MIHKSEKRIVNWDISVFAHVVIFIEGVSSGRGFPRGSAVKNPPACLAGIQVRFLGQEDPPGEGNVTSNILAWKTTVHWVAETQLSENKRAFLGKLDRMWANRSPGGGGD